MRQIGKLDTRQHADRFASYLTVQGIESQVEEHDGQWTIWIKDEDRLDDSRNELASFRKNTDDPRYAAAAREARQIQQQEQQRRERAARNTVDVRQSWNRPLSRRAPLTTALIGACIVIGLLSNSLFPPRGGGGNKVFRALAFYDPVHRLDPTWRETGNPLVDISRGQIWRLATPAFLHGGLTHLIFNMIMLFSLGGMIESRRNTPLMLVLFLLCSTAGNVGQHVLSQGLGVGMSGVVYGLFGYIWIYGHLVPQERFNVRNDLVVVLLAWLVLGFAGILDRLLGVSVANWAHLFGMLMGILVAVAVAWLRDNRIHQRKPPANT